MDIIWINCLPFLSLHFLPDVSFSSWSFNCKCTERPFLKKLTAPTVFSHVGLDPNCFSMNTSALSAQRRLPTGGRGHAGWWSLQPLVSCGFHSSPVQFFRRQGEGRIKSITSLPTFSRKRRSPLSTILDPMKIILSGQSLHLWLSAVDRP